MTTLNTRPGQGLNATVYADRPLEGYTVTVEFADQGTFSSVDLTKTPTGAGREVVINLSSTEVDLIKNSRFRVRATKSGSTKTVATGVVNYTAAKPIVVTTENIEENIPSRLSDVQLKAAYATRRKDDALRSFWAALSKADSAPVDVLCIGTSLTEGGNITDPEKRWTAQFRDLLRRRFQPAGVIGGEGYVPAWYAIATVPDRWSTTGSPGFGNYGLGKRSLTLANNLGQTATLTFTGTGVDLLYAKGPLTGTFTWAVDGAAATSVNTKDAAGISDGWVVPIRGLAAGSHTLTVTQTGSTGSVVIEGAMVYNGDETKGVRIWEGGHSGYTTADYLELGSNDSVWWQTIKVPNPDLVVLEIGANDEKPAKAITPAQFRANLVDFITRIRANCTSNPSIVLVATWARLSAVESILTEDQWTPYFDVLRSVSDDDPQIEFLNLRDRFGTNASATSAGLLADQTHITPSGAWLWAHSLYEMLLP